MLMLNYHNRALYNPALGVRVKHFAQEHDKGNCSNLPLFVAHHILRYFM